MNVIAQLACLGVAMALLALAAPNAGAAATHDYRIYVTNETSGDLTVLDQNLRVVQTIALGKRPRGLQLSADGKHLYVALSGSPVAGPGVDESTLPAADKSADGIGVVDLASGRIVRMLKGVSDPEQLVLSRDERRVYVASEDTGSLVVIDVMSGAPLASIPVGKEPEGIALDPHGRSVYVSSEVEHRVSVIDTAANRSVAHFDVGLRPRSILFSEDGAHAYVTGENDASLTLVDARQHKVIRTVTLSGENVRPVGMAMAPDRRTLYLVTGRGGELLAVDAATLTIRNRVGVGPRPWNLALSPDGALIFTANGSSDDVTVVDARSMRVLKRIPVGKRPWGVIASRGTPLP